jgi:hypothetical protein
MINEKIKNRTDSELLNMMENYNQFQEGFVIAAYHELKKREVNFDESEIQKYLDKIKKDQVKIENENIKQRVITDNLHSNIKKGIYVLIGVIIIRILLMALTTESTVSIGFISIPYFAEILNIGGLGLIVYMLYHGHIRFRYLFLFGFLFSLLFEIVIEINVLSKEGLTFFTIFHLIFVGIRFLGVYYLFNKQTNNWYKEIINIH